ncbi:MAG TPA: IPT/TIG domain-containing protein [Solirubrobacteraceae bacterium]|nr:IPT/TIG domain-containing protein [Solirubrobacteraceae bacterium]
MGDRFVGSDASGNAARVSWYGSNPRGRAAVVVVVALLATALFALMLPALARAESEEPPTVLNQAPQAVGRTTAILQALVDPNNAVITECEFEWGTSPSSLTETTPCEEPLPEGGENFQKVYSVPIAGLTENTKYYYRIVAVSEYGEGVGTPVKSFTTLPTRPSIVAEAANGISRTAATLKGKVNPNDSTVTKCEFLYSTSQNFEGAPHVECASFPGGGEKEVKVSAHVTGLSAHTTYYYRLVAGNAFGEELGSVTKFRTPPREPNVVTEPANHIGRHTVTLNGSVNPRGSEIVTCEFEYGTTVLFGSKIPCSPTPTGEGESPISVSAEVTGLNESTTYYFRLVATNALGAAVGAHPKFTTIPTKPKVITLGASHVTNETAQLNATVNPNALMVTLCEFEWGTSTAYGHRSLCSAFPGEGEDPVAVSAVLTGLSPATTYDYRIVAGNSAGTNFGPNFKITTPAEGPPVVTSIAMRHGSTAGGTKVTIHGEGFTPGATVMFGSVEAASVKVESAKKVVAITPPEPKGTVEVTVTTPNGTSASTSATTFEYREPKMKK